MRGCVEGDLECGTETPATTVRLNCAVVQIDKMFGNRKSQTKSTELAGYRRISLLKWRKQRIQPLTFDSNSIVPDFEMEMASVIVRSADSDLSPWWREFHRVVNQVPKHLLKPNRVTKDVGFRCVELDRDMQFLCCDG